MHRNILVTGGAGFIGSHLVDKLLTAGHKVKVIDNLLTGKKENINAKATFYRIDLRDLKKIKPHFKGIDYVFHVAAYPRVQISIKNPALTNEINIDSTLNVLIAARDKKVKRVIYSASSSAYGDIDRLPLVETMQPRPMSPYGLQKYVGEEYCRLFSLIYGLQTVSLRYFSVYGPRMAEEGAYMTVIAIFLRQRAEGKPLTITGDGSQTRDFTHVDDVVRANFLAMKSKKVGQGEVINIGAGKNYSIKQIAKLIGGPTKYIPPRIEPYDTLADRRLAKKLLDWQPKSILEKEIEKLKKANK